MKPRRPRPCSRAYSLIEATVTLAVTGLVLVAALNTLGAARVADAAALKRDTATWLAEGLAAEVAAAPLTATGDDPLLRGSRRTTMDYDGLVDSPPTRADGSPLMLEADGAAEWSRSVTLQPLDHSPLGALGAGAITGALQEVTITVRHRGRIAHELRFHRSRAGLHPTHGRGLPL